jgi:hypothetical protein
MPTEESPSEAGVTSDEGRVGWAAIRPGVAAGMAKDSPLRGYSRPTLGIVVVAFVLSTVGPLFVGLSYLLGPWSSADHP